MYGSNNACKSPGITGSKRSITTAATYPLSELMIVSRAECDRVTRKNVRNRLNMPPFTRPKIAPR